MLQPNVFLAQFAPQKSEMRNREAMQRADRDENEFLSPVANTTLISEGWKLVVQEAVKYKKGQRGDE